MWFSSPFVLLNEVVNSKKSKFRPIRGPDLSSQQKKSNAMNFHYYFGVVPPSSLSSWSSLMVSSLAIRLCCCCCCPSMLLLLLFVSLSVAVYPADVNPHMTQKRFFLSLQKMSNLTSSSDYSIPTNQSQLKFFKQIYLILGFGAAV